MIEERDLFIKFAKNIGIPNPSKTIVFSDVNSNYESKLLKEHVALDRTSWSIKKRLKQFVMKCIWFERC